MAGTPETIRTSDTRIRNPVLYPLSYGGTYQFGMCGIITNFFESAITLARFFNFQLMGIEIDPEPLSSIIKKE